MNNDLIESFKLAYSDLSVMDMSRLDEIYAEDLLFKDPIHEIRGLQCMQDYMAELMENVHECRFEFLDQLMSDNAAYIKWNMHYRHNMLSSGKLLTLRGISQIHYSDRVHYHEDVYDVGAMLYEHVPMVGGVTRWLKGRLAG